MFDLAPVVIEQADQPTIVAEAAIPDQQEPTIAASQPKWMTGLTPEQRLNVCWVAVADLKTHSACDFLPFLERSYATVLMSMEKTGGVLFPLAVAMDGRVLDGRYRLQAAKQLGIEFLPVLTIDFQGDDAVSWVFEVKDAREHMSEAERAFLAVQFQRRRKGQHIKVKVAKMNLARTSKAAKQPDKKSAKSDSRLEACKKYKVSERSFRAANRMANDRPDLFEQVVSGQLDPETALKKRGGTCRPLALRRPRKRSPRTYRSKTRNWKTISMLGMQWR